MEARAGNSILDFETLFSNFQELLNGSGLSKKHQEMKLQFEPHVSIEPAAVSFQQFNWSGPPLRSRNFLKEHLVHVRGVPWEISCSKRGAWPVEPLQGSCSWLIADVQASCSFISQYNTMGVYHREAALESCSGKIATPSWVQHIRQLRKSLSICIWFQDGAHLSLESIVLLPSHPHRSPNNYFSISV